MNRLSISRKFQVFILRHPKLIKAVPKPIVRMTLPKGYRKITKK